MLLVLDHWCQIEGHYASKLTTRVQAGSPEHRNMALPYAGSLPDWWYRLSTQQRRIARVASVSCTGLILLVILLSSTLSTRSNPQPETFPAPTQEPLMPSSGQETTTASGNTQATPVPTPEVDPPPPRPPSIDPFTVPPKTPVSPRNTSAPADGSAMVPLVFSPVAVGSGPGAEHCSWTDYRLPETVKPLKVRFNPCCFFLHGSSNGCRCPSKV